MAANVEGLHHITAISGAPQRNLNFYAKVLGLRFVKKTVNFDDPSVYHLYYGTAAGAPGTAMTFFPWERMGRGRPGVGETSLTQFAVPDGSLPFWRQHLEANGALIEGPATRFGEEQVLGEDPDGLRFALVVPAGGDAREPWSAGGIEPDHAIRGFHGVTLDLADHAPTAAVLEGLLDYEPAGQENGIRRYVARTRATPTSSTSSSGRAASTRCRAAAASTTSRSRSPTGRRSLRCANALSPPARASPR